MNFLEKEFSLQIEETLPVSTLSGGELTLLNLAIGIIGNSELLLLDEPTNHLDIYNKAKLVQVLKKIEKTFILITHDKHILESFNAKIWIVQDKKIINFTGTYKSFVQEEKRKLDSLLGELENAKKEDRKRTAAYLKEQKRVQNVQRTSKNKVGSMGKAAMNYFQNKTEKSKGKTFTKLESKKENVSTKLVELKNRLRKNKPINPDWEGKRGAAGRKTVLRIDNLDVQVGGRSLINNIDIKMNSGEKTALVGKNGTGKSTLLKCIFSDDFKNQIYSTNNKILIDQDYTLINPKQKVVDILQNLIPNLDQERIKKLLADYLLFGKENFFAKELSGGEIVKLTFAIIEIVDPELIILDEPTNHLDLETQEIFATLLKQTTTSTFLVTHSPSLLNEVDIDTVYEIKDGVLVRSDRGCFLS